MKGYYESTYYKQTLISEDEMISDLGRRGEYMATCAMEMLAERNYMKGFIFNNSLIELPDGIATEIDLIFLSRMGVHVVEVKNRGGNITAESLCSKQWTQHIGESCYDLYNPLRQNLNHINYLAYYLRDRFTENGMEKSVEEIFSDMVNVVVFTSDATWEFNGDILPNSPFFMGCLNSYESSVFPQILSDEEVDRYRSYLFPIATTPGDVAAKRIVDAKRSSKRPQKQYCCKEIGGKKALYCIDDNRYTLRFDPKDQMFKPTNQKI